MTDQDRPAGPFDGSGMLEVDVLGERSSPVVRCRGELDAATAPLLREVLEGVEATALTLDLEEVSFIDSAGIQAIAAAVRRLGPLGGSVEVCSASRPVRRVFEIVGLSGLITR